MQNKKWLIAVVLGIVAGGLHITYVRGLENEARGGEMIKVLALSENKSAGQKIKKEDLAVRDVPSAYVDSRVIRASGQKEVLGAVAAVDLMAGQMIQWSDFTTRLNPTADDLAEMVESGKRAVTIPVDKSLSMGGMLRPGHRVDILGTFAKASGLASKERVTVTLLQNVLVIATGSDVWADDNESGKGSFNTVTLSVGIEEAQMLSLATTQGKLSLALRGRQDLSIMRDVPEKSMEDVLEPERRNAIQQATRKSSAEFIERLKAK